MATIVVGVTGSIAAYKACELVRLFIKEGHAVHVVMTAAAQHFVTPLTFQTLSRNVVSTDMFAVAQTWEPGHISLAQAADVLVIAPCTANVAAKLAHGVADDYLTSIALATAAPMVLAPAMNDGMYANVATRENLTTLRTRGVHVVDPATGDLACGTTGRGRLAPLEDIVAATRQLLPSISGVQG